MRIIITGGAGYVGSLLVPELLKRNHEVYVIDTFWFGNHNLESHENLKLIQGDIRSFDFKSFLKTGDTVIHLACISNDPSFDLDPKFSKEINLDASLKLIISANEAKIKRFIYASSSSVYGLKKDKNVTENLSCEPITLYAVYKAEVENILNSKHNKIDSIILRPATLCGAASRVRLDVVLNLLVAQAFFEKKITVFGGDQYRPQLNIRDMVDVYIKFTEFSEVFGKKTYNVSFANYTVTELAKMVCEAFQDKIDIEYLPIFDERSYRVDSSKIRNEIGLYQNYDMHNAIRSLINLFNEHKIQDWKSELYHNVKMMKRILNDEKQEMASL